MIDLGELFKDRRTPWQKFRDKVIGGLLILVVGGIFVAGIIHVVEKVWH